MAFTRLLGLLLATLALSAFSPVRAGERSGAGQKVLIFAAASTTNAVDEIRDLFARQSGVQVRASYASSATLAQQIVHGAEADLFLSADPKWVDYLAEAGLVADQRDLLGNRMVIVVPADSRLELNTPEDLLRPAVQNLAVGDPESVPAGKYARQALEKLGLWERLRGKVTPGADVRHALTFVETGAAEAGIVYSTDAAVSRKVRVAAAIPRDLTQPIRYPLALLKTAQGKASAQSLFQAMGSPSAAKVFQKYGFEILVNAKR